MADPSDGSSPGTETGSWNRGKYYDFNLGISLLICVNNNILDKLRNMLLFLKGGA